MVTIAVDGMGGDYAPMAIVKGAEKACAELGVEVILVGDEGKIRPHLSGKQKIEIVHTPVVVEMQELPSQAIRKKRDSSMNKALELLKSGRAQGFVSAGNSGAAMGFAIFTLGRIGDVERPAIATLNPNIHGGLFILLDAGGNVDCKPLHLVQFALMGDACAKSVLGIDLPKVGLLSNGTESTKGNELTRDVHAIMKYLNLNYVGYVEGTDMYTGNADVVVTDGFVGNVALKISEGTAEVFLNYLREVIGKSWKMKVGYLLLKDAFDDIARRTDYSEYGGAPLLGVDGTCIICHGKSTEKAIKNAIGLAKRFVEKNLNESIKEKMQNYHSAKTTKEMP